jgi:hypothetical protein
MLSARPKSTWGSYLTAKPDVLRAEGALLRGGQDWVRFLSHLGADPHGEHAFEARNFLLDEGIGAARVDSYAETGAMRGHASIEDWQGVHWTYLTERVFRQPTGDGLPKMLDPADEISCPETFRFLDPLAPFLPTDSTVHLIRIERLRFVADFAGVDIGDLRRVAEEALERVPESIRQLNAILGAWERVIESRPVFAAFWDDVFDLFGKTPADDPPGWEDALRDSLGLLHYDPGAGRDEMGILVFKYPVSVVPRLKSLDRDRRPLVPPTVLDNSSSPAFLPAPRGSLSGHVIDLGARATSLRREVLHPGVPFEAKHLWRVGTIRKPVDLASLPQARGLHILMVRDASGRKDYALGTDGDLE